MSRKVIIDCDPGIDDAVALLLAMFDPRLDVLAVTACGGNVSPAQASRNAQVVLEQLDPPRYPRLGAANEETYPAADARHIHGDDGLGNVGFEVSQLHHAHPSDKLICDIVRAAPDQVTIITLGPLTNIAAAFSRDPELPSLVDRIIMLGGTLTGPGNITPAAEFNIFSDPMAARAVFRSRTTKTLIPLDISRQIILTLDMLDELPGEETNVGAFLRRILPPVFRSYRQLGQERINLHDAVAILATLHPELFETKEMAGDVEVSGELTTGATVFDLRTSPSWRPNMEVATTVDVPAVTDQLIRGLKQSG
ncbi:MAG: nucleoside hydrolase [Pirellulaceae bacterium]|nr:nucleoside hydrolase [Pirellulaceae bacterium]